jgi:hypothetical protein
MTAEQVLKRVRLPVDFLLSWRRASILPGAHPISSFRLLAEALQEGFWPSEAYRLGVLHPAHGRGRRRMLVSKRRMVKLQRRLNPGEWEQFVGNKALLYGVCRAAGIPIPEVYAFLYTGGQGMTYRGGMVRTATDWERFFGEECPSPFVVKPTLGHHGMGVWVVVRTGTKLTLHTGELLSVEAFVRILRADRRFEGLLVQKRMMNHELFGSLIAGRGLATLRMITFQRTPGACDILHADLKIPLGDNVISNLSLGKSGNMVAEVCLETGTLTGGLQLLPGIGSIAVEMHPETGAVLSGFQVPFWHEIRALAVRAAAAVTPVRTVGWDVIVTPEGPMVLEGNIFYDPPNSTSRAAEVTRALESWASEDERGEQPPREGSDRTESAARLTLSMTPH